MYYYAIMSLNNFSVSTSVLLPNAKLQYTSTTLDGIYELSRKNAIALRTLAENCENTSPSDTEHIIEFYEKASELGDAHSMNKLGTLMFTMDKIEAAIKYYKMAIQCDFVSSFFNLGYVYDTISDFSNAITYYKLSSKRGCDRAMNNLAIIYKNKQKYTDAIKYYKMAIRHENKNALYNLALLYCELSQFGVSWFVVNSSVIGSDIDENSIDAIRCLELCIKNKHPSALGCMINFLERCGECNGSYALYAINMQKYKNEYKQFLSNM